MNILTLHRQQLDSAVEQLRRVVAAHNLTNAFNPSFAEISDLRFIAFRAQSFPEEKPFRAYVLRIARDGSQELTDLTERSGRLSIPKAADPKLVSLGAELYVTFNTGNVHQGQNDIYLQRIHPTIGAAQRCDFPGRRMVEKNWGFFSTPGEELRFIYSLSPMTLFRLAKGQLGTDDELIFEPEVETETSGRFPRLHLGSQPLLLEDQRALVVANQQWPIPGLPRKIYFGRLAELDLHRGKVTRLSRRGLIHSWASMLPQRQRHNPGLFSATYFSGLTLVEGQPALSYGINDLSFGIATIAEQALWER